MPLTLRPGRERGHIVFDWLDTHHSFSFGTYHDPAHMGFRGLRVINEDIIVGGAGFPPHGHEDMEIVTYILSGALSHTDSLGSGSTIRPGQVQRMSAGTGIKHSEYNGSATEACHLLQIWLLPDQLGLPPSYEEATLPEANGQTRLDLIAAPQGGAVAINCDTKVYRALLAPGGKLSIDLLPGRHGWVQVARGEAVADDTPLEQGDGLAVADEPVIALNSRTGAELLVFDLA